MGSNSDTPPPGTVRWDPELSSEEKAQVAALRARSEPYIRFTIQLREALGLSQSEFLAWMQQDEFEGLPLNIPRPTLSLSKLWHSLNESGGKLSLVITLGDGSKIEIPQ